jgi:ribosomal protein S3
MAIVNDKRYMNDLEAWVKQVWMLPNIEDKKLVALDLVDNMEFKRKADAFRVKINSARSGEVIDKLCTDILLSGEGLRAI